MMDVELVPIGTLDRHNLAERRLDDALWTIENGIETEWSLEEQIVVLMYWFLAVIRRRNRCHRRRNFTGALQVEFAALVKVQGKNPYDPIFERVEKALMMLPPEGAEMAEAELRRAIADRQLLQNAAQTARASTQREKKSIDKEIGTVFRRRRDISAKGLEEALKRREGNGIIVSVTSTHIVYRKDPKEDTDDDEFDHETDYNKPGIGKLAISTLGNKLTELRRSPRTS